MTCIHPVAQLGISHLTADGKVALCGDQIRAAMAHLPSACDQRCFTCWRELREQLQVVIDDANLEAAE